MSLEVEWDARVKTWEEEREAERAALVDPSLTTEEWWRVKCRAMNPPPKPLAYREFIDRIVGAFERPLVRAINTPCVLPGRLA